MLIRVASNGGKNVCPAGWHVPSYAESTTLFTYLGGESVSGSKLKETGTTHWASSNTEATNETGFTALPGAYRSVSGAFNYIGIFCTWWSEYPFNNIPWAFGVGFDCSGVYSSD